MMKKKKRPPKWTEVYPQGTHAGNEEQRFFIALERDPKYTFKSTEALAKEAKLTPERVEQICNKYFKKKMVFQNPANHEEWGYWERNLELLDKDDASVSEADQKSRVDSAIDSGLKQTTFQFNTIPATPVQPLTHAPAQPKGP